MRLPSHIEPADGVRFLVMLTVGGYVFINRDLLVRTDPVWHHPDLPAITRPVRNSAIKAGLVEFEGTGVDGETVEVVENGRIVGISRVQDKKWKVSGKVFGEGPTTVYVRALGTGLQSALVPINVEGKVEPTLIVLKPADKEFLDPGRTMFKGLAKPGDEIIVSYNGSLKFRTIADAQGHWWKAVDFELPVRHATVRAQSKAQGEIVEVRVTGSG